MDLPDPPKRFDLLVDQYDNWPRLRKQLDKGMLSEALTILVTTTIVLVLLTRINPIICLFVMIFFAVILVGWNSSSINTIGRMIALQDGHPLHDSERATGRVGVAVMFAEPVNWMVLSPQDRLWIDTPVLGEEIAVHSGDAEGPELGKWTTARLRGYQMPDIVKLVNQAQILSNAQARPEGDEDPFERAREREDGTSDIEGRTWEEPTPGELMPQKGALLRLLKGRKDPQEPEDEVD